MKPTFTALSLSIAALLVSPMLLPGSSSAAAQTKKPVHHHRHSAAKHSKAKPKTSACTGDPLPTLSATIPAVTGCPVTLYALRYVDTVAGTGTPAAARKFLTVNYTGYLADGTKFDTSIGKQPISFPYGAHQVITGWDTGFQGMNVGGKRRLYIPYQLAYGDAGRPPVIPAKAALVFDVELLAVSDTQPQPQFPTPHPAAPAHPTSPGGTVSPPAQPGTGAQSANPTTDPTKPTAEPPTTTQTQSNPPKS